MRLPVVPVAGKLGPKFARHHRDRMAPWNTVDEPELYVIDFSESPGAAEYRTRIERARREAWARYRDHLTAVCDRRGVERAGELARTALDVLTVWRYTDSGEHCRCSCHLQLPETDLHGYGFDCVCQRAPEDRGRAFTEWCNGIEEFWRSPEGQQIKAEELAEEAELQAWQAFQEGVVVGSHGGLIPEEWSGQVDDRRFYFRERHGEWRIELDLRPNGRFARVFRGTDANGDARYEQRELDEGDVIAYGTTADEGYGTTPLERAQFIVDTIRIHLARQACTHHRKDLPTIQAVLGTQLRWCPTCGTRLPTR